MTIVTITEEPLVLEDLLAVADGAKVELADGTREMIAASREVVDHTLSRDEAVYGLTTQVGHGKDTRLTEEEIRGEQMFLVMSHSGGVGPALPTQRVRAALAVRLNGIARGGSGASPGVADVLIAMLNAGVCTRSSRRSGRSGPATLGPWPAWLRSPSGKAGRSTRASSFPAARHCGGPGSLR
jgi:histidine ammonia-lyase